MSRMAAVTITQNSSKREIQVTNGILLSAALVDAGIPFDLPCGGKGTCKKCTVSISGKECLACQTRINGDVEVRLADTNVFEGILTVDNMDCKAKKTPPLYTKWGVSIDIGTTTVCASLIGAGGLLATAIRKNPQAAFGADIISRIEKALGGELSRLTESIESTLRDMICELADKQNIFADEIDAVVITGNTTMLYFLTGQSPESLSQAPFKADRLFGEYVVSDSLRLGISKSAKVYLPRCISAFLGADITTAILSSSMYTNGNASSLLVDIGTNGELALWHNGALYCASTAAGPAFESGGISRGVYGVRGAIDKAWIDNGKICALTIGAAPAVGICGSGIIDVLSAMLKLGIIDKTGAFQDGSVLELQNGIEITAQDVRKIQLAKGSIRAGIETLIETSGIEKSQIEALCLAGGFGNYLDIRNAAAIGLIPPELLPVTKCIGNAAHAGACMLLQDESLIDNISGFLKDAKVVALESSPVFTDNFMRFMMFE